MAACASLCLLCPVRVQVLGVAPARCLPCSPTPLTIAGARTPWHSPPGGTGAVLKGPRAVKSSVQSKGQDVHGWIRAWGGYAPGEQQAGAPHAPLSHRAVTWTPGASETLPTRAHGRWGPHGVEGLCASTGRRAWGTGGPSPRILFLHGSCLPPRHHPLPETQVSPRPLAWLSHKPSWSRGLYGQRGQNAAVLQGTTLVAPRVNPGGRRNQGTVTPPPRGGSRPARPRRAPAPTPASASQRHSCSQS